MNMAWASFICDITVVPFCTNSTISASFLYCPRKQLLSAFRKVFAYTPGLEIREYGCRDQSRWPRGSLYAQKLALTSPTSGGRSVGIVRSRTHATEFSFLSLV
jgi:hypothetical protein